MPLGTENTSFTHDIFGRYICNTLQEALDSTTGGGKPDPLALKITGGVEPLTVLVNGVPASARADRRTLFVEPDGPGFLRLTVIDARGTADSVMVRLQ